MLSTHGLGKPVFVHADTNFSDSAKEKRDYAWRLLKLRATPNAVSRCFASAGYSIFNAFLNLKWVSLEACGVLADQVCDTFE